jgi:hypothetical protein
MECEFWMEDDGWKGIFSGGTMSSQATPIVSQSVPNAQSIFDLATRAKHLFVAGELGIFEKLAQGPATLETLAAK